MSVLHVLVTLVGTCLVKLILPYMDEETSLGWHPWAPLVFRFCTFSQSVSAPEHQKVT